MCEYNSNCGLKPVIINSIGPETGRVSCCGAVCPAPISA